MRTISDFKPFVPSTIILGVSVTVAACSAPQNESAAFAEPMVQTASLQTATQVSELHASEVTPNPACSWTIREGRALNDSFSSDEEHTLVEVDVDGMGIGIRVSDRLGWMRHPSFYTNHVGLRGQMATRYHLN